MIIPEITNILGNTSWTLDQKKSFIESTLMETGRPGIENIINLFRTTDFYVAPSSTIYHSNYYGGLVDHTLVVYIISMHLWELYSTEAKALGKPEISQESVVIASMLHDICKINFYMQAEKWKKNEMDQWIPYQGYEVNDRFPIGHGEKSVMLAMANNVELTVEEMIAIRWHMGAWEGAPMGSSDRKSYMKAMETVPLATILQSADHMASMLFEFKIN